MRLKKFAHFEPGTLSEACQLLEEHGDKASVIAGGTDLLPNMKRRQQTPGTVVGLRGIEAAEFLHQFKGFCFAEAIQMDENGALAHPAATGGALATEAPPVWAHPIPEEDAHFWDYWRVLVRMHSDWQGDQNYSVGQLVPFAALYLLWQERAIL